MVWKEEVMVYVNVIPQHLPKANGKNHETISVASQPPG
jgi:hypothetical protein